MSIIKWVAIFVAALIFVHWLTAGTDDIVCEGRLSPTQLEQVAEEGYAGVCGTHPNKIQEQE